MIERSVFHAEDDDILDWLEELRRREIRRCAKVGLSRPARASIAAAPIAAPIASCAPYPGACLRAASRRLVTAGSTAQRRGAQSSAHSLKNGTALEIHRRRSFHGSLREVLKSTTGSRISERRHAVTSFVFREPRSGRRRGDVER